MSSGEKFLHLTDYVTDRLNPILVKETRQALKSRQFIITFMLLLTVAWLISVFGVVLNGPAIEFGALELREQVPVGPVQFDAVNPGGLEPPRSGGKGRDHPLEVLDEAGVEQQLHDAAVAGD